MIRVQVCQKDDLEVFHPESMDPVSHSGGRPPNHAGARVDQIGVVV
jgi:hypothetical protein